MTQYDELIKTLDTQDIKTKLKNFQEQIYKGVEIAKEVNIIEEIRKIAILSIGDDNIPGLLLKQYLSELSIPVFLISDYEIPHIIDKETLVFVVDYLGSNEETINMYRQSVKVGAKTITLTSGGKLRELASLNRTKHINLIPGLTSSHSYLLSFFSMAQVLDNSRLIDISDSLKKFVSASKTADYETMGRNIATKLNGKTPIIFSTKRFDYVAKTWKQSIGKDSLIITKTYPELLYETPVYEKIKNPYVLVFRDEEENPVVSKKIEANKKEMKEKTEVTEIGIRGNSYLTRILSAAMIGTWTSYYISIMNEKDPSGKLE